MYRQANTMQYDDDGERLRRISCADRDAFEQLYLDYHKRLVRFLCRVIRRDEDLEELQRWLLQRQNWWRRRPFHANFDPSR